MNARLPVVGSALPPELAGGHLTEALLEPLPRWLTKSPYLGDLGLRMMREYVGDLLLHIQLPTDFPGLWVADAAHCMECKHMRRHGRKPLGLGYDCANGRECTEAEARSYIPLGEYRGGHVAPIAKIVRPGQGLAVPNRYIGVTDVQPLRRGDTS